VPANKEEGDQGMVRQRGCGTTAKTAQMLHLSDDEDEDDGRGGEIQAQIVTQNPPPPLRPSAYVQT
jgi:hypothetical protein